MFLGKGSDWPGREKALAERAPAGNGACEAGFNNEVPFGGLSTVG